MSTSPRRAGVAGGEDAAVQRREVRREQHLALRPPGDGRSPARSPACGGGRAGRTPARPRRRCRTSSACFSARPAPLMPVMLLTTMPVGSISARGHQRRERQRGGGDVAAGRGDEAGALQLGRGTARAGRTPPRRAAPAGRARSRTTCGYSEASFSRYAAERSTTQPTLPTSCGASAMLASCGRPRNTTSNPSTRAGSNSSKTRSGYAAARLGYSSAGQRAGLGVAGRVGQLEVGVLGAEPQQLGAGVARRADDRDPLDGVSSTSA